MTPRPLVQPADVLDRAELTRYSRHVLLPGVGAEGQRRLKNARVLVIGAGGLGSPALLYLAAAGVGTIGVVDDDVVALDNLQRQIMHTEMSVGNPKTTSARESLAALNSEVSVVEHCVRLTRDNALELFAEYDVVLDGSDNFSTRYLINDAAVLTATPYIWGSVYRFDGAVSVFATDDGPCYRCVYPVPPDPDDVPSCGVGGIFGAVTGVVGAAQAVEAIKLITGVGEPLIGRIWLYDAGLGNATTVTVGQDPSCPMCGTAKTITSLIDYDEFCTPDDGRPHEPQSEVTAAVLDELLEARSVGDADFRLIDVREVAEQELCVLPDSEVHSLTQFRRHEFGSDWNREDHFILYCKAGVRSARAVSIMKQAGFENVRHLGGGILSWLAVHPEAGSLY